MSGGEQQMLALGRALMLAPKILLVDEPSVGLAPILVSRTIDKIKELKDRLKLTVLMAEQNFTQALRIADRGYVIVHGKIAFARRLRRRAQQQRPDPEVLSGAVSSCRTLAPPHPEESRSRSDRVEGWPAIAARGPLTSSIAPLRRALGMTPRCARQQQRSEAYAAFCFGAPNGWPAI